MTHTSSTGAQANQSALHYYWRSLSPFVAAFLIIQALVRSVLIYVQSQDLPLSPIDYLLTFSAGLLRDLGVFIFFLIPLGLIYACRRKAGRTGDAVVAFFLYYILLFTGVSEYFFWDEFQSRFNFIAVDYLVYTQEVIGNIQESYPLYPILGCLALISLALAMLHYWRARPVAIPTVGKRWRGYGVILLMVGAIYLFSSFIALPHFSNRYADEISKNGMGEFFSAFWNNELDYERFYASKPVTELPAALRQTLGITAPMPADTSPLLRPIANKPAPKQYNVVFITVESLSAVYLGAFGDKNGLTPNLDKLAKESLVTTNLYATGTRTVYGLSALTLSIPPIPGNSIVRRPDNGNLASIGSVLKSQGYDSKFIYGGFGYFDNMNEFFSANGYGIYDRSSMKKEEISFANVWGVSDEDLFDRVLRENDRSAAEGKPFFDMIMTTSNHRPYTYPADRIDIPSKTGGRFGGVKYTDYAIGRLLEQARSKPWFEDTIFVIVADHTAGSSGKSELDPGKYHIPCFFYAPKIIKPGVIDGMISQIDIVPTLLSLMGVNYDSQFYGVDVTQQKPGRAFISNYQKLGYMEGDDLLLLKPVKQVEAFKREGEDFVSTPDVNPTLLDKALTYFESATQWRSWSRQQILQPQK